MDVYMNMNIVHVFVVVSACVYVYVCTYLSLYVYMYVIACFDGLLSGDVRCVAKVTFCNYVLGRNVLALAGGRH